MNGIFRILVLTIAVWHYPSYVMENGLTNTILCDIKKLAIETLAAEKKQYTQTHFFPSRFYCSLLYSAVRSNDCKTAKQLLDDGPDLNEFVFSDGTTVLHEAAKLGYLKMMKLLISYGADVNAQNREEKTPLHVALGHPKIIALLLISNADPSITDNDGMTPLHTAVQKGFKKSADCLICLGAELNAQAGTTTGTPLHFAAYGGYPNIAALLLRAGAHPCARNVFGLTPEDVARKTHHLKTARLIRSAIKGKK